MALRSSKICKAALCLAIAALMGAGCGDPQLNQSRREPFFVGQELISAAYAPGLIVVTGFPDLNPLELENPRFVSSNPSVATASAIQGRLIPRLDVRELAIRLNTGAPGTTEITLFDGDELIRTVPIQVSRPKGWRFDFTYQNAFAPSDAALTSDEPIAILERGEIFATVEFSRTTQFSPEDLLIGSGRIDSTSDLLLEVQPTSFEMVGAGTDVLRFNQLTSGDLVSIVTAALVPIVGLELPNGESLFSSRLASTSGFDVEELEVIVSREPENDRADVAVYGRTESGRVLGLAPVVTLDDVPLQTYTTGLFGPTFTWLFRLPRFGPRTGTLEARWRDLDPKTVELGSAEIASCTATRNTLVYETLEYTSRDGTLWSGTNAAVAIGIDCLLQVDVGLPRGCGSETFAVVEQLPSPSREVTEALTACVEECLVEVTAAIAGQSLTPNCALCYASFASCSTEFCTPQCAGGLGAEDCVRCNDDAGCSRNLSTCSAGVPAGVAAP
jgi:hypothetical protein